MASWIFVELVNIVRLAMATITPMFVNKVFQDTMGPAGIFWHTTNITDVDVSRVTLTGMCTCTIKSCEATLQNIEQAFVQNLRLKKTNSSLVQL